MTIVAVTGGRDYFEWKHAVRVLDEIHSASRIDVLVHGGADGADQLAQSWAVVNCVQLCEFRVTNRQWTKLGKSAGPIRNRLMLKVTRPDLLVAFPGGKGTADCIAAAEELGIEVRRVK